MQSNPQQVAEFQSGKVDTRTGFTLKQETYLWEALNPYATEQTPFDGPVKIFIPGACTYTVYNSEQARNLQYMATGKPAIFPDGMPMPKKLLPDVGKQGIGESYQPPPNPMYIRDVAIQSVRAYGGVQKAVRAIDNQIHALQQGKGNTEAILDREYLRKSIFDYAEKREAEIRSEVFAALHDKVLTSREYEKFLTMEDPENRLNVRDALFKLYYSANNSSTLKAAENIPVSKRRKIQKDIIAELGGKRDELYTYYIEIEKETKDLQAKARQFREDYVADRLEWCVSKALTEEGITK